MRRDLISAGVCILYELRGEEDHVHVRVMHVWVCMVCFEAPAVSSNDVAQESAESDEAGLASAMDLSTDLMLSDSQGERGSDRERERTFGEER